MGETAGDTSVGEEEGEEVMEEGKRLRGGDFKGDVTQGRVSLA